MWKLHWSCLTAEVHAICSVIKWFDRLPILLLLILAAVLYDLESLSISHWQKHMGADLCSTLGGRRMELLVATCWGWVPPPAMGSGKILEILYAKPYILGNICAIIGQQYGSVLLCWILMLRHFYLSHCYTIAWDRLSNQFFCLCMCVCVCGHAYGRIF